MFLLFYSQINPVLSLNNYHDELWDRNKFPYPVLVTWSGKENTPKVFNSTFKVPANSPSLIANFYSTPQIFNEVYQSNSQANQDIIVAKYLNEKKNGYFVDLAANDYKIYSNTLNLERKNQWSGICVEPNPKYHVGLLSNRTCLLVTNPVSSYSNQIVDFNFHDELSGIISETTDNKPGSAEIHTSMTTISLMQLFHYANTPRVIDYLSLDVEGSEYDVLEHFDFGSYTFLIMTIERPIPALHKLLAKHNYWYLEEVAYWGDIMYIHESLPNFHHLMMKNQATRNETTWALQNPFILHPSYAHHHLKKSDHKLKSGG